MYSAAAPAACGEAMLVPLMVLYPPSFHVERMHTPGAAISISEPSLLKVAKVSSEPASLRQVVAASAPPWPSKSAMAETVITSGWLAGL